MVQKYLVRYGIFVLSLIACVNASAQTPAQVNQANEEARRVQQLEQLRQQEQFIRDRTSASPRTQLPVPEVPEPAAVEGLCRDVKEIHVRGVTLLPVGVLDEIVARYVNRCLGVSDIESLLSDITRAYVERGWIAVRAYLPQQDLSQGSLEVLVVEGEVSAVEVEDGGKNSISVTNVAPFAEGKPLNLRDFEQALDQINRLASNNATIEMRPGEQPGETVVILRNEPSKPWHVRFGVDNHGSESTGRTQAALTLSLDNPLRFNDFVSYTRRENVSSKGGLQASVSDGLSYVIPFGYSTLSLNLNKSHYTTQIVTGAGTALISNGTSRTNTLRLDRVLHRDASSRWNGYANLTTKDSKSYLEGVLLGAASRRLTVLDVGLAWDTAALGGALTVDVGLSQGLNDLGAMRDASGLVASDPRAQFRKWNFSGNYFRPFTLGEREFQFSSQWAAQYAEDVLYGSEQMLIGGIYSVRGFDQSTISGDHGFYIRNEVGFRRGFEWGGVAGSYRPWVGLDYGHSWSRNDGVPEGELTGLALGVQVNLRNGVSLDLFASTALNKPDHLSSEAAGVWAQLGVSF